MQVTEMPQRYGKSTAHRRLQNWQQQGIWENILSAAVKSEVRQDAAAEDISCFIGSCQKKKRHRIQRIQQDFRHKNTRCGGTKRTASLSSNVLQISMTLQGLQM